MRRKLSPTEVRHLRRSLPAFGEAAFADNAEIARLGYERVFVSVFERWLGGDPRRDQLLLVDHDRRELRRRRDRCAAFASALCSFGDISILRYNRRGRPFAYRAPTVADVLGACDFARLTSLRGRGYCLLLPERGAIVAEEWDWTVALTYRAGADVAPLFAAAKTAGLHILTPVS